MRNISKIPNDILIPPVSPPTGDVRQENLFNSAHFSHWLGLQMEEVLKAFPRWQEAHPILLGSWARGELSPRSDLDLLFAGDQDAGAALIRSLNEAGYKVRSRFPADPADWTAGVEAFDILALLKARPLTSKGADLLRQQQKAILQKKKSTERFCSRRLRTKEKNVRSDLIPLRIF